MHVREITEFVDHHIVDPRGPHLHHAIKGPWEKASEVRVMAKALRATGTVPGPFVAGQVQTWSLSAAGGGAARPAKRPRKKGPPGLVGFPACPADSFLVEGEAAEHQQTPAIPGEIRINEWCRSVKM